MAKTLRILAVIALMAASGSLSILMAGTFLMNLGLKLHGTYEYYGSPLSMALVAAFGTVGFAIPALLVLWLQNSRQFSLRALFAIMTAIAVLLGIYAWSF